MLILVVAFAVSGFSKAVLAAAPANIISYQGRLLNSTGVPVADAALDMQFEFTTDTLGVACVWSNADSNCGSTANMSVTLTDGLFSVNLGDTGAGFAAIPDSVFADNEEVFLKVIVEGETLLPLKQVVAAPYALNSQTLDGLDSSDFCQGDGTNCDPSSTAWETSAFGTYEDDDDVIVGTSGDETIAAAGFALDGNNLFVAGDTGVEGTSYSDTAFNVADTTLDVGALSFVGSGTVSTAVGSLSLTPGDGTVVVDGSNILGTGPLLINTNDGTALTLRGGDDAADPGDDVIIVSSAWSVDSGGLVNANGLDLLGGSSIHWDVSGNNLTNPTDDVFSFDGGSGVILTTNYGGGDSDMVVQQGAAGTLRVGSEETTATTIVRSGTGGLALTSTGDISETATGDLNLNLAGGDVIFGQATSIGTGGQSLTINSNGTLILDDTNISGTGELLIGAGSNSILAIDAAGGAGTIKIGSSADATAVQVGNGIGADTITVGTNNDAPDTITIGSVTDQTAIMGSDWNIAADGSANFDLEGAEMITVNSAPGFDVSADAMTINFAAAHDDTATNVNYGLHIIQTDSGLSPEYGADALVYLENATGDGTVAGVAVSGMFQYGIDLSAMGDSYDLRLTNSETIDNGVDDTISLTGVGGGDNTDIEFNLDGTMPVVSSATDASVSVGDNLLVGATSVAGVKAAFTLSGDDIYAAGDIAAQSNMYADSFVAGDASTTFADGSITSTGTSLVSNIDVTAGVLSHTVSLQVDGNPGVTVTATGNGLGGVGNRTIQIGASADADNVAIGDGNADVGITDGQWSVSTAGAGMFTSLTMNGGNIDMNNNLITNIGNGGTDFTAGGGLTLAGSFQTNNTTTLGDGGDSVSIDSSDWDIDSVGAVTGIASISGDNNQNNLFTTLNVTGTDALVHTIALQIDGNTAISVAAQGNGAGGVNDRTVQIGVSGGSDIVTIGDANANVTVSDTQWSVDSNGQAVLSTLNLSGVNGLDTTGATTLSIGTANASGVSICNSTACDMIQIGTNFDADTIQVGDVNDTLAFAAGNGDVTYTLTDDFIVNGNNNTEFDLNTSNSAVNTGVLNVTTDTLVSGNFTATSVNLTTNNGAVAGDDFAGTTISLFANDADADMFGLGIQSKETANAAAGSYESLIVLKNSEATVGAVTDAIKVSSASGVDGDITTGLNVSETNITNAISVGANTVLGTNAAIDFSEFDVSASTGSITIDDVGGNAGQISVEGSKWDIDDLTFSGSGRIATTGATTLVLDANVGGNGAIETSAGDSLMMKASDSGNNLITDSPTFTLRGTFDSDPTAGVSSTTRDITFAHDVTAGGASPSSQLAINLIGGSDELTLSDIGDLLVLGGIKAGDTSNADQFQFTTATAGTDAFQLTADSVATDDVMQISADGLTTGRGIFVERANGAGNFTGPGLLNLAMLDATSSGKVAIFENSGTGSSLFIDQNADTGTTVNSTTGGALHIDNSGNADYGLTVYSNQAISATPLAYFWSANAGFDSDVLLSQMDANAAADNTSQDQAGLRVLMADVGNPSNNNVNNGGIVIDTTEEDTANGDNLQQEMFQVRMDSDNNNTGRNTVFAIDEDGDFGYDGTAYTTAVDVAEMYPTSQTLVAGELVMTDASATDHVVRTASAYQSSITGIVSTRPGVLLGSSGADGEPVQGSPIALNGRVPTFVSDENGPIFIGDAITSSSTAGVGMKSTEPGMIVGYALEDYSGSGTGSISVFVNPGFYAGNVIGTDGTSTQIADDVELTGSLALRGSSGSGITAAMSLVTDVTDATDYRLSIQNTAGAQVAYVSDEGDLALSGRLYPSDRGAIQTSKYIYYDGSSGMGGDFMRTNASGWATGSYDFAEMFPSSDRLEAGDLVVFGTNNESVARSTSAGSTQLAGIVSTRPGFLAGENLEDSYPIALAGRVPTKVNLENGPINVGDPLTSSSVDGVAMKAANAGVIVGYALEPYTGSAGSDDKIVAFVSVGYWNGNPTATLPGTNNAASTMPVTQNASNLTGLNMNGNIYMTGNEIVGVSRIAGISDAWSIGEDGTVLTEGLVQTAITSYQGDVVRTTAVTSPDVQITLTGTATLQGGEATVNFEDVSPAFNDVISTVAPIRVIVTPNGPVSLYVQEKNAHGFGVRQLDGNSDGITFDWMVTAYRKDYEPAELLQVDDGSVPPPVEDVVASDPVEDVVTDTIESTTEAVTDDPSTEPSTGETTDVPADPVSPDISTSDSTESTSVDTEPAPSVLPADDVLSTGT